jgi:nucleoside-diphosphate-sugar epimerase
VEWIESDLFDVVALGQAMEGIDAIIHSAAIISFTKKERKEMYRVNVEGTANVVNMALEKNVNRLVHISSVAALGRKSDGGHVNEEKKWEESKVNTHYGKSKNKAELEIWRGIGEGLEAVILNPSTLLGYGDWTQGSCVIFKNAYDEFSWYSGGTNGFVDVEDMAKVTLLMLESGISGERYIVNADNWPFKKLQDTMADGFGRKHPRKKAGAFMTALGWRAEKIKSILTGKKPLLTKENAKVAQSRTYFENNKILKALPSFNFRSLDESISLACKKYLSIPPKTTSKETGEIDLE